MISLFEIRIGIRFKLGLNKPLIYTMSFRLKLLNKNNNPL